VSDVQTWFEEQVIAALEELPAEFASKLSNLEVIVEPRPLAEHRRAAGIHPWQSLYGLYQGVPLPSRATSYGLVAPDVITIFSEPLMRDFPGEERLRAQIRHTVLHEIAHHFGISDDRLRELGAY
jgi:predicted Zn-dependent protease with MMP-like domain